MKIRITDTLNAVGCIEVCCAKATSTVRLPASNPTRNFTHVTSELIAFIVSSWIASVDFIFLHNF